MKLEHESKAGRPTKFSPDFCEQARKLCQLGATDQEIADFFSVDVRSLYRWKNDSEEFCQALKEGKQAADKRVEESLYQRAIGFENDAVKVMQFGGKPVVVPYREKIPPDTTACIFWLKNRQPDRWRDVHRLEHSGPDGGLVEFATVSQLRAEVERRRLERGYDVDVLERIDGSCQNHTAEI